MKMKLTKEQRQAQKKADAMLKQAINSETAKPYLFYDFGVRFVAKFESTEDAEFYAKANGAKFLGLDK